jgi:hypothetical protein
MTPRDREGKPSSTEQLHDAFGVLTDWFAAVREHLHWYDATEVRRREARLARIADVAMVAAAVVIGLALLVAGAYGVYAR